MKIGTLNHPVLDKPRIRHATSGMLPEPLAFAMLDELSTSDEMTLFDFARWDQMEDNSEWNGPPGLPGPRVLAALPEFLPKMRAAVDFNPGDNEAVSLYIDALAWHNLAEGTPFPTKEVDARFAALFAIGPYDPDSWARFAYIRSMYLDPATMQVADVTRIRAGFENAAFYSNSSPEFVGGLFSFNRLNWDALDKRNLDAMDATGEPAFGKEEFNAGIVCPTIRSVRVLDAMCEGGDGQLGCPDYPMMMGGDPRPRLIERARSRNACTKELEAAVENLLYERVPFDLPD